MTIKHSTAAEAKKKCYRCKKRKPLSKFHLSKREKDGHTDRCKACCKIYCRERYEKNPISHLRKCMQCNRKQDYGLEYGGYEKLLKEQNGVCAICKQPETRFSKRHNKVRELSVDHDHKTGLIRGLLCDRCNNGLARFHDRIDLLIAAIKYLASRRTPKCGKSKRVCVSVPLP